MLNSVAQKFQVAKHIILVGIGYMLWGRRRSVFFFFIYFHQWNLDVISLLRFVNKNNRVAGILLPVIFRSLIADRKNGYRMV